MQRSQLFTRSFILTLVSGFIGCAVHVSAQVNGLTAVFEQIRSSAIFPVAGGAFDDIHSTFGPRIRVSTSAYDWHRGIDIDAPEGTPVGAALDGTFFGIRNYSDGGLTVILRHSFPSPVNYLGRSLVYFYTYHMHLSSVEAALQAAEDAGQTPFVPQGTQIGTVGHSGTAVDDHLHWEVRVGTPYSLEWQLDNPTSTYGVSNFGFDPHVHPMFLTTPYAANSMALTLVKKPGKTDGSVHFSSDDDQPLLNRVTVEIRRRSDNRLMASHVLDFNERVGFDASTNVELDTVDTSKPFMSPLPFGSVSPYGTDIVIPKAFVGGLFGNKYLTKVTVHDIWGREKLLTW